MTYMKGVAFCCFVFLYAISSTAMHAFSGEQLKTSDRPTIISPSHPRDSLGEIVYTPQGDDERSEPIVSGILIPPHVTHAEKPKFTKSMKHDRFAGQVTVECVVTAMGKVIDVSAIKSLNAEAAASAMQAVARYRFKPATLDGTAVATLLRVEINYRIF